MNSTVLLVDDEKDILELLKYNLQKEGFRTLTASNGKEALALASRKPDLVVLDVMMPQMDGWEVCKSLRQNPVTARIPIIFLTAKDDEIDEVVGLELGADDYITKPVRIRTFLARVKRVLRSTSAKETQTDPSATIRIGDLEVLPENYIVRLKDKDVPFPRKEFEVLLFLVRHPDRVIKRETLLNEIWGRDVYVVDRTIDVHIRKIREKLGGMAHLVETVKGVGYRFKKEL
ncbi:MAG TPA: response regulator transcription factor [Bacteroidota bacterium]